MKRNKGQPIPKGTRVKLNGEQEWKDVLQVFEDQGYVWISTKDAPTSRATMYIHSTDGVQAMGDNTIICSMSYDEGSCISASEFIKQYGSTIQWEIDDYMYVPGIGAKRVIAVDKDNWVSLEGVYMSDSDSVYNKYNGNYINHRPATKEEIEAILLTAPKEEPTVERMYKVGDIVKIIKGGPAGQRGVIEELGVPGLYWIKTYSGEKLPLLSGEEGCTKEFELYKEEPLPTPWSMVTKDGVTVYEGSDIWWVNEDKTGVEVINSPGIPSPSRTRILMEQNLAVGYLPFSTYEAAEEYRKRQCGERRFNLGDWIWFDGKTHQAGPYQLKEWQGDGVHALIKI